MAIEEVKERHEAQIMAIPGVVGMGIGESNGQAAIVVMLDNSDPALKKQIPHRLEGHPVIIDVTGKIRAEPF